MRIAVMQPYLFPYIGYFQLLESVDRFVIYDDVTFIKQGWINRNNILLGGKPFMFTVPLVNASSYTLIRDTAVNRSLPWAGKLMRTIEQAYRKAPYYSEVATLIENTLRCNCETIGSMAMHSISAVAEYLGIQTQIIPGSSHYANQHLAAQDRVIDICRQENADRYHNPIGGIELYSRSDFSAAGIELLFVQTTLQSYPQLSQSDFVPWLSIIDVMMFNSPAGAMELVSNYKLV